MACPRPPDLVLFTGDLTRDTEEKDVHAQRMKQFQEICSRMKGRKVMYVPGEHDAGLDGGQSPGVSFKETYYSFDQWGVHFIALDNVRGQAGSRSGATGVPEGHCAL